MEAKPEYETTPLGFRDITSSIPEGVVEIRKNDLIRGVLIKDLKTGRQTYGERAGEEFKIGNFYLPSIRLGGRVFPMDELIQAGRKYDLLIQKVQGRQADTQIYHDFYRGEEIEVRVTGFGTKRGEPTFKFFNRISGFVKQQSGDLEREIELGDYLLISVLDIFKFGTKLNVWTKAIRFLE